MNKFCFVLLQDIDAVVDASLRVLLHLDVHDDILHPFLRLRPIFLLHLPHPAQELLHHRRIS